MLTASSPDLSCSLTQDTITRVFFIHPRNLAFHDLTPGRIIPDEVDAILGLSLKFKFELDDIRWFITNQDILETAID